MVAWQSTAVPERRAISPPISSWSPQPIHGHVLDHWAVPAWCHYALALDGEHADFRENGIDANHPPCPFTTRMPRGTPMVYTGRTFLAEARESRAAATGRAKSSVNGAIEQLSECGVLEPLSTSRRNRSWEAVGLLDLLEELEEGRMPEGR